MPQPEQGGGPRARFQANITRRLAGLDVAVEIADAIGSISDAVWDRLRPLEESYAELRRRLRELLANLPTTSQARWIQIGPTVIARGVADNRPPVAGRVVGIALAPRVQRVYLATSNGGVWRSDDDGRSWRSMMEPWDWDRDPLTHQCDTLSCGAVAVDPTNPDRVWVGTGDGQGRDFGGIGPVFSADAGIRWVQEASDHPLAGEYFYKLAVDPGSPECVVGATTAGLFTRSLTGGVGRWTRTRNGSHCSVVVARTGNTTTFYAAQISGSVVRSTDGVNWGPFGTGFPASNNYRIELAVRPDDPTVVYALLAAGAGTFGGLWRIDTSVDDVWRRVGSVPDPVPSGQGDYDLAIAVDPLDAATVYIAGDTVLGANTYVAQASRLQVSRTSGAAVGWTCSNVAIGTTLHPDVHALVVDPSDRNRLWAGCDGGVFRSTNAKEGTPVFKAMNTGLAIALLNWLDHHPDEDAVVFSGTQDNGGVRSTGSEVWYNVFDGDCGSMQVHWTTPYRVTATYINADVYQATDGANDFPSWGPLSQVPVARRLFYSPLINTPKDSTPAHANRIAFGGDQIAISDTFGSPGSWRLIGTSVSTAYSSLVFASHGRIYGGTIRGEVYRLDETSPGNWSETPLHGGDLPVGYIAGIAVTPPSTATPAEPDWIYVCFAGQPSQRADNTQRDTRRVWRHNGTEWQPVSTGLLDVQHNAIIVDPDHRARVIVGADIGIWRSDDNGDTWVAWSAGLPDAAVKDLQIHRPSRMIRASTFGRSMFERHLDLDVARNTELWVRDSILDTGRNPTATNADDPTRSGSHLDPSLSPDIKVDVPSAAGTFRTRTTDIDIFEFDQVITDRSDRVGTVTEARGTLANRVYVQVRSRGVRPADDVKVTLLLAEAPGGTPPALPAGYEAHVRDGTDITGNGWTTVARKPLVGVRAGHSRVAGFELSSSLLPRPNALSGHDRWCLLALLHHDDDRYTATETDPLLLSRNERKAALKRIRVRRFNGTMPLVPTARAWYRIQPVLCNVPIDGCPPEFRIYGEENGRAVVELAWDQDALMAPSGEYEGNQALRYYSTGTPFEKQITKADGTPMTISLPTQPINLVGNRTTWTIPAALWRGYQCEAAKAGGAFTHNLYYRVRVQPAGSSDAIAWPADTVISGNPDAPHMGILRSVPADRRPVFPDQDAFAAMSDQLWQLVLVLCWALLGESDPDRQALARMLAQADYTAMTPAQRAKLLELWVVAGPTSRQKIDQLVERRVWASRTTTRPAAISVARSGGKTLVENLLELRWINPHPDLVGVASNEQLVDDVITEILDPNGQINQGTEGMGPLSAMQALLIHVSPAEYARLMCGLLSASSNATLANGDTVSVPPGVFQYSRYGTGQTRGFNVRTNSELAFHAALLAYGQDERFPEYDPSAAPDAAGGIVQVFDAVIRGGLQKAEQTRALGGLFAVTFTASSNGPSATVRDQFLTALDQRLAPVLAVISWKDTGDAAAKDHVVLAMRRDTNGARVVFKNPEYAGSNPPTGRTAGALLGEPQRRVEDPTQALESMAEADLATVIKWFHTPQQDLVS